MNIINTDKYKGVLMTDSLNILSEINHLASNDPAELCRISEKLYDEKIKAVADAMLSVQERRILMLAGPSSAGKTTSAKKLKQHFNKNGIDCFTISLDDFYLGNDKYPLTEDGTPDYESILALDLPLLADTTEKLLKTGECSMPVFDFTTKKRIDNAKTIKLDKDDIVIFEGLHALNPILTDTMPSEAVFKMYVSLLTRIYDAHGNVILGKRDLRFTRRMVRDFKHRDSTAETTYSIWKNVKRGEDKYLFPFETSADVTVNSFHPCEACILKKEALEILSTVSENSEFYLESQKLKKNLELFLDVPVDLLSENSLLREFAG